VRRSGMPRGPAEIGGRNADGVLSALHNAVLRPWPSRDGHMGLRCTRIGAGPLRQSVREH
jgi:hypothetical protein